MRVRSDAPRPCLSALPMRWPSTRLTNIDPNYLLSAEWCMRTPLLTIVFCLIMFACRTSDGGANLTGTILENSDNFGVLQIIHESVLKVCVLDLGAPVGSSTPSAAQPILLTADAAI